MSETNVLTIAGANDSEKLRAAQRFLAGGADPDASEPARRHAPTLEAIASSWRGRRREPEPEVENTADTADAPSSQERMHGLLFLLAATELFTGTDSPAVQYLDDLEMAVRRWRAMEARVTSRGFPSPSSASRSAGIMALGELLARRSTADPAPPIEEEQLERESPVSAPPDQRPAATEPSRRLLGVVEQKLFAHYAAAVPAPSAEPSPGIASGLREVLNALHALPGWDDLPESVAPADLQLATECAERTGMLRQKLLTPVFDYVARILQLPQLDPSQARRSASTSSPTVPRLRPAAAEREGGGDDAAAVEAVAPPVHHEADQTKEDGNDPSLRAEFDALDLDGDGFLSAAELRQAEQLQLDLVEADVDGDGRVSYDEFVRHAVAGQQLELRPEGPGNIVRLPHPDMQQLTVALGWHSSLKLDLDASVLLLRKKKKQYQQEHDDLEVVDCVYFSNPRAAGVAHQGDRVRGGGPRTRSTYNRTVAEELAEQLQAAPSPLITPSLASMMSRASSRSLPPPASPFSTWPQQEQQAQQAQEEEAQEEILLDLSMVAAEVCHLAIVVNVYTVDRSFQDVQDAFLKVGSGWPSGHRLLPGPDNRNLNRTADNPAETELVREIARFGMGAASLRAQGWRHEQEELQPGFTPGYRGRRKRRCNGMLLALLSRCETEKEEADLTDMWDLRAIGRGGEGRTATDRSFQADVLRIVAQQQHLSRAA